MPTYQYRMPDGKVIDRLWTISQKEEFEYLEDGTGYIDVEGQKCKRIYNMNTGGVSSCWPMKSWAAGVHPDQIPEMIARDKAAGVPTEYTKDGEPLLRSRGHRKEYLTSRGLHDRDGGYSD